MIAEEYCSSESRIERTTKAGGLVGRSRINDSGSLGDLHGKWWQSILQGTIPSSEGPRTRAIRFVDLCCGCGGLTLGLAEAARAVDLRLDCRCAVDVDVDAVDVYATNFAPALALARSISSIVDIAVLGQGQESKLAYEPTILDARIASLTGTVDLVVAGPPCQGHSNFNNRTRHADPRNSLYLSVVGIALALQSPLLVIENVPEVKIAEKDLVATAKRVLVSCGYETMEFVLNAADFGFAQTRRRHFLVASKKPLLTLADVTRNLGNAAKPISWAIGDLVDHPGGSLLDSVPQLSEENRARINYLFAHDLFELPNEVRPACHQAGNTYPSVYGRLRWDQPAQTITTGFLTPGRGRYVHPLLPRVLTPHEAARLQGFPDWFKFSTERQPFPTRKALTKWIGEAVPSVLGYVIGLVALESFS